MADPKSRARVERLLRGEFRPDDLAKLFIFARDHCDGRESITDIGAFIAHHTERDRGIVTRSTRDWFAVARYHMATFGPNGRLPHDSRRMPPETRDYFKLAINRMDPKILREGTGFYRAEAHKIMQDLANKLTKNEDGTWAMSADLSKNEQILVEFISSVLVTKGAFEAESLCEDFIAMLKSNGLITKDEIRQHKDALSPLVQLFAVAAMHNCAVDLGNGTMTQLRATAYDDGIVVNAMAPTPHMPRVLLSTSLFTAKLDPSIHCHPDLLLPPRNWHFEIELAPDKRLSPLR